MRITTTPPLGAVPTAQPVQRAERARNAFELPGQPRTEDAKPSVARAPAGTAGLETLLAVQGMQPDDRRDRRRRALQRGRASLDLLDELKLALIAGEPVPVVLLRLRGLTASGLEATGEDGLDGVLAEIDLRAQVELAKRAVQQG
ncbi:flagellar assembly protein FliX [Phreatobacter sp.]|uniref:flagellar assembly protein FliX n=1 Tax=Phreatobacter sp. TaxID=1966341 RepID=UPI003F72A810